MGVHREVTSPSPVYMQKVNIARVSGRSRPPKSHQPVSGTASTAVAIHRAKGGPEGEQMICGNGFSERNRVSRPSSFSAVERANRDHRWSASVPTSGTPTWHTPPARQAAPIETSRGVGCGQICFCSRTRQHHIVMLLTGVPILRVEGEGRSWVWPSDS